MLQKHTSGNKYSFDLIIFVQKQQKSLNLPGSAKKKIWSAKKKEKTKQNKKKKGFHFFLTTKKVLFYCSVILTKKSVSQRFKTRNALSFTMARPQTATAQKMSPSKEQQKVPRIISFRWPQNGKKTIFGV
jgi:hypothetical protein